jgi:predicted phosphoribosyltransferase
VKVPGYEAISMGTVARGVHLPDKNVVEHAGISLQAFFAASSAEQKQLDRHEVFLRSGRPAQAIMGRTIILVDNGLTAESDLPAAIEAPHRHGATKVVVAVPVTTLEARDKLSKQVDEFVSLHAIDAASRLDVWCEGCDRRRRGERSRRVRASRFAGPCISIAKLRKRPTEVAGSSVLLGGS